MKQFPISKTVTQRSHFQHLLDHRDGSRCRGRTQLMVLSAPAANPGALDPSLVHTSIVVHRSACSAHGTTTPAPCGVVPEAGRRATGRALYSAGHGHRVLSITASGQPYSRTVEPPVPVQLYGSTRTRTVQYPYSAVPVPVWPLRSAMPGLTVTVK